MNQKRLDLMLGNSSVMHMGYIFLAIAALIADGGTAANDLALPAAVLLMFAHGISIAMLFSLSDRIQRATGTLELDELGGLATSAPKLALLFGIAGMASLGLPGLANFAGELLVFLSAFQSYTPPRASAPSRSPPSSPCGAWSSAVYMLRAYRRIFQGPAVDSTEHAADLTFNDRLAPALLGICLLAVGLYPNLLLHLLH